MRAAEIFHSGYYWYRDSGQNWADFPRDWCIVEVSGDQAEWPGSELSRPLATMAGEFVGPLRPFEGLTVT